MTPAPAMPSPPLKALLWDVDGTLAETERDGHRIAFNLAFEAFKLPWQWSVAQYGVLLSITGGYERLLHDLQTRPGAPQDPEARHTLALCLHQHKNALYAEQVRSGRIPLREGVLPLMQQCRARGLRMAIVTTTSRGNVDALLRQHLGDGWAAWFAAQVCGEDVARKKPDPQAYQMALDQLGLRPENTLALEDAPAGVTAARAAGVPVVVTRSAYFADAVVDGVLAGALVGAPAGVLAGVLATGPGLGQRAGWLPALAAAATAASPDLIGLDDLLAWHARRGAADSAGMSAARPLNS